MKTKKKFNVSFLEKDDRYGNLIREYVKVHDWNMTLFKDVDEVINSFVNTEQDVLIFDIEDDLEAIKEITNKVRVVNNNIYMVFIGDLKHKCQEPYLQKPFPLQELTNIIINRADDKKNVYQLGNTTFDAKAGTVTVGGKVKTLLAKEKKLLFLLCNNMNSMVERSVALETIWNCNDYFNARSMDVYLSKLRKLFNEEPKVRIENVLRKGYILHVEE